MIAKFLPLIFAGLLIGGSLLQGYYYWMGPVFLLVVHPLLDYIVGNRWAHLNDREDEFLSELVLKFYAYTQLVFFVAMWVQLPARLEICDYLLTIFNMGILNGALGLTVSHELVHRPQAYNRFLGVCLLSTVGYGHYRVEHVFGHHRNVATPKDPVSAWDKRNAYVFLPWSIVGSFLHAYDIEKRRNSKVGGLSAVLANRVHHYILINIIILGAFYYRAGWKGALFFALQALVSIVLLELVDYIEHYGLVRTQKEDGKYEAQTPKHSWDTDSFMTNSFLFNLGKHSHHHASPAVPYHQLKNINEAPKLPWGYSTAIVLALIPPLYRKLVEQHEAHLRNLDN